MNNLLKTINFGEVINSAMKESYGPLAIVVFGIVAVFSIYMSYTTKSAANQDAVQE